MTFNQKVCKNIVFKVNKRTQELIQVDQHDVQRQREKKKKKKKKYKKKIQKKKKKKKKNTKYKKVATK